MGDTEMLAKCEIFKKESVSRIKPPKETLKFALVPFISWYAKVFTCFILILEYIGGYKIILIYLTTLLGPIVS